MAEPIKRSREEEEEKQEVEENKRHKSSYNDIISILEEEEEEFGFEPDPEIKIPESDIFTTLQQELDLLPNDDGFGSDPIDISTGSGDSQIRSSAASSSTEEDDRSSVIRHLLEASDDELGIPSGDGVNGSDFPHVEENEMNGGDFPFAISDGLWELEDEAANYYSLLQSELFM